MPRDEIKRIVLEILAEQFGGDAGDLIVSKRMQINDGRNVQLGTGTGTKWGTATTQKQAWFNKTPVIQQSSTGTVAGFTTGVGTTVTHDATFNGGSGTLYTIGDIVKHLKTYGFLAD